MGKYFTTTVLPDMGADGATTALSTAFTDKIFYSIGTLLIFLEEVLDYYL